MKPEGTAIYVDAYFSASLIFMAKLIWPAPEALGETFTLHSMPGALLQGVSQVTRRRESGSTDFAACKTLQHDVKPLVIRSPLPE